jgi:hypothetical protein
MGEEDAHFVFVDYPAPGIFIFALVEALVFDDLVHRHVLEACRSRELLCMCCLAHAGCACDYDVWVRARHGRCCESRGVLSQSGLLDGDTDGRVEQC